MASSAAAAVAMAPSPPSSSPSSSPSPCPSSFSLSRHTHLIFANRLLLPPQLSSPFRRNPSCMIARATVEETSSNNSSAAASALSDSVIPQVAVLEDEPDTPGVAPPTSTASAKRKPSPLERGGTLTGDKAAGKDPSPSALGKSATRIAISGPFRDPRWKNGTWDLQMFMRDGKVDWDAVIDAEVLRRKWLEENPEASRNEEPVVFETSTIPWWAWVKRFHLPEAELLNGRAAMIGFFVGYVVDSLTGVGLVDQTSSFFGKLLLFISVLGVLFIRKNEDVETLKQLVKEWNFYDKQWQATWQEDQTSSTKSDE